MFRIIPERCTGCGNCRTIQCSEPCSSCGTCQLACPSGALIPGEQDETLCTVTVNGVRVRARGTVKNALEAAGFRVSSLPDEGDLFAPCGSGGCWACSVSVNGRPAQACITPPQGGMVIETMDEPALRYVSRFGPHTAGGVGTPHHEKTGLAVEVVCFAHGCNLRCPQCQKSQAAFTGGLNLLDPEETVNLLLGVESVYRTGTVTFSGGECTLNRAWLIKSIEEVRKRDGSLNIHVDTNGTILTRDYIDELVLAGMRRIGIDLKGLRPETFMRITGMEDRKTSEAYLENSWDAIRYIATGHREVFLGVGVPYNSKLISVDEIRGMAALIGSISRKIQVTVLDYRSEFRCMDIERPSVKEMLHVKGVMEDEGLEVVLAQTEHGFMGP